MWKRIAEVLERLDLSELIITGHSLGAALAVLTTAQLYVRCERRTVDKIHASLRGVYTFGQPAVGDARFCSWLAEQSSGLIFRHVYGRDVVPLMPTADVNPAYRHLEAGIWTCERNGDFWQGQSAKTNFELGRFFFLSLLGAAADFAARRLHAKLSRFLLGRLAYSFDDHSPMNYLRVSKNTWLMLAGEERGPGRPADAPEAIAAQ